MTNSGTFSHLSVLSLLESDSPAEFVKMQTDRKVKEGSSSSGGLFDRFGSFGGFSPGSLFGSGMFGSGIPFRDASQGGLSKEPVIEELLTDDEEEDNDDGDDEMAEKDGKLKARKYIATNSHPLIEHPDDIVADVQQEDKNAKDLTYKKAERPKSRAHGVSFKKVTYGGVNGVYYTATTTLKSGGDGVVLEECQIADKTTGEAAHRVSRGIHDKGHSVTRTLNSGGQVDTSQTLHNLNEDDLADFEQSWKVSGCQDVDFNSSNTPGTVDRSHWALPFESVFQRRGGTGPFREARTSSSNMRPKKVVQINIE